MRKPFAILSLLAAATALGCGPGSNVKVATDGSTYNSGGSFYVVGTNLVEGVPWQLNRPIRLEFNHAVDPSSINFGSIQFRFLSGTGTPSPVTGVFELEAGSDGRVVVFRPACPTDEALSNGAFLPNSATYEVYLPSSGSSPTVLRDIDGRSLEQGLTRTFSTPSASQPAFLDMVLGPPVTTSVTFPEGLNLFTDQDNVIEIFFNQPIDGRSSNLNLNNLMVLYSDGEIGSAGASTFPASNMVPGTLYLTENCTDAGAKVEFHVTGILPVNRNLVVRVTTGFGDIVGQTNLATQDVASHSTPTLAAIYNDSTWVESSETVDEFQDSFMTSNSLDLDEPLPFPLADVNEGYISAGFEFPGSYVGDDVDFYLANGANAELRTTSQVIFTDSNNRNHTINNGVLTVNDFTIESGATLRGRGENPLVIYATGAVDISGTLNLCGNNATWPTSLQSPWFAEGGANGECGGGRGGDASQVGTAETLRAEEGDAPFGATGGGGIGGESSYNQQQADTTGSTGLNGNLAGGGGGGGFTRTMNESVLWDDWSLATGFRPNGVDDSGPDHDITRHTRMVLDDPSDYTDFGRAIFGSEDGLRGSARTSGLPGGEPPRGMEDGFSDTHADGNNNDPAWTTGDTPPFYYGHVTHGPDGGAAGPSIFFEPSTDRRYLSDFWGSRLMLDGSVNRGAMLAPWAGSGGGGSGDAMCIGIYDKDEDGYPDPLDALFPVVPFVRGNWNQHGWVAYRKGAGGGGGGGQLLIMAIGNIKLGANSLIQANGGVGMSGESMIYTQQGISGSGGGAGGHIVLHTSGKLDLRDISIGSASTEAQIGNLVPVNNIQAFGGRRGWAAPTYYSPTDGNQTFAPGRGGSGANGIVQIHVPDPTRDILWHANAQAGITDYLVTSRPSDEEPTDRTEVLLDLFSAPTAYCLIPFYSAKSMVVSEWIDTGAAELRLGDPASYPDFGHSTLKFSGTLPAASGVVQTTDELVSQLADVATGLTSAVTFTSYTMTLPSADTVFDAMYLRSPQLLVGYDIVPNNASNATFEVTDASYNATTKVMTLSSRVEDGPLSFAVSESNPNWSIRQRYFRFDTSGIKDSLPSTTRIIIQFQVADAVAGTNTVDEPFGGRTNWISDLSAAGVAGHRFIRYRVIFDVGADSGTPAGLDSPLPLMDYMKIPLIW